jgi:probable DNA metabolism protein
MLRQVTFAPNFAGWQQAARRALAAEWQPEVILWQELSSAQPFLDLAAELEPAQSPASTVTVPKPFLDLSRRVACHSSPDRWDLMYRALWRLTHGERHLLELATDPEVQKLQQLDKAVRHDVHKMRAFVRFRAVQHEGVDWFVAWFEPQHHIVEWNAPFFVDRFASMNWSILTPDLCAHWNQKELTFTDGVTRSEAPSEDATEALWLRYYGNIFNPARVKIRAMEKEMPKRYWKNLPEAAAIPALLNQAPKRVSVMMEASARESGFVPQGRTLQELREESRGCTACPLYRDATQTVFGEGPTDAQIVLLGEQPGDREDLAGRPFIGPAGQLLDQALVEAGLDRSQLYLTNAVKHFKFDAVGKRRMHHTPSARDIAACRIWLTAELRVLQPQILVCLGGSAATSVLGKGIRVLRERGRFMPSEFCPQTFITVHPSSLLRAPDETTRAENYKLFVADLRAVRDRSQIHSQSLNR